MNCPYYGSEDVEAVKSWGDAEDGLPRHSLPVQALWRALQPCRIYRCGPYAEVKKSGLRRKAGVMAGETSAYSPAAS